MSTRSGRHAAKAPSFVWLLLSVASCEATPEVDTRQDFAHGATEEQPPSAFVETCEVLDSANALADDGAAYILPYALRSVGDREGRPLQSTLRLFEDGIEIGPAHSTHADIRALGRGRFSHWGDALHWSSSDNSDPRQNGRVYAAMVSHPMDVTAAAHDEGKNYILTAAFGLPGDSAQGATQSSLRIFEDGVELGPAHSLHQDIRELGAGRFSHWGNALYFSSRDGTDPRTNGRAYSFVRSDTCLEPTRRAPEVCTPLSPGAMSPEVGQAFVTSQGPEGPSDGVSAPTRATTRVYEDGRPLGPAHSSHEAIRQVGRGRFSHWGETLYFSSSDGTDPRSNGRAYTTAAAHVLPTVNANVDEGRAFALPLLAAPSDSASRPTLSQVVLFEDGVPLGPAHSTHEAIRTLGGGRFSHWNGRLYFSSSDGSDVRTNGRVYSYLASPDCDDGFPEAQLESCDALDLSEAVSDGGVAWRLSNAFSEPGDTANKPGRSRLMVFEDGRPLGLGHRVHDEIRTLGAGRFSHWYDSLIFSASDNTDPRTNGRRYSVKASHVVKVAAAASAEGHALLLEDAFGAPGDSPGSPAASSMRLFEDGVELGPAHSAHAEIRERGQGRFSHWNNALYFSSSDGTDPRTNGRTYTYVLSNRCEDPSESYFRENFLDTYAGSGDLGPSWQTSGTWQRSALRGITGASGDASGGASNESAEALLDAQYFTDARVSAWVDLTDAQVGDSLALVARRQASGAHYAARLAKTGAGYRASIERCTATACEELSANSFSRPLGMLTFDLRADKLTLSMAGAAQAFARDATITVAGQLGLRAKLRGGAVARFGVQQRGLEPTSAIQVSTIARAETGYATFQSINQRVVETPYGWFTTWLESSVERPDGSAPGVWKLARSRNGGQSWDVIDRATIPVSTKPPVFDVDAKGNLYLVYVDWMTGAGFFRKYGPQNDFAGPALSTTLSGGLGTGKYAVIYDAARDVLWYMNGYGGRLWRLRTDGTLDAGWPQGGLAIVGPGAIAGPQYTLVELANGSLIAAWTSNQNDGCGGFGSVCYYDIRFLHSADGLTWKNAAGEAVSLPVAADGTGSGPQATVVTRGDEATASSLNWLANIRYAAGKLHFMYRSADANLSQSKNRMEYVRWDWGPGARIEDKRVALEPWAGRTVSLLGLDGFFSVGDRVTAPLVAVSHAPKGGDRVGALISRDAGSTWSDLALANAVGPERWVYAVGGARRPTADGWVLGTYTEFPVNGAGPGSFLVRFFKVRAR